MAALKISDADFKKLVQMMQDKYGINLTQKRTLVEGRLNTTIQSKGFKDFTTYLNSIYADKTGTEMITLLNKLTTNHTYFYREPEHYEFMRNTALPYFETQKKDHKVAVWSAASSSGEEPYTNTMQLMEYFDKKPAKWQISVLATDISEKVLNMAKEAVYRQDSMKNLDPSWQKKYFTPIAEKNANPAASIGILNEPQFKLKPEVTSKVKFQKFNLMERIPFRTYPFDIIFCRNVMIYFELKTKIELVKRLYEVLAPGGYLFIGHAESIPRDATPFKYVKPAIYRKEIK